MVCWPQSWQADRMTSWLRVGRRGEQTDGWQKTNERATAHELAGKQEGKIWFN